MKNLPKDRAMRPSFRFRPGHSGADHLCKEIILLAERITILCPPMSTKAAAHKQGYAALESVVRSRPPIYRSALLSIDVAAVEQ